jgi:chromosomal replication initiator protein
VLTSDRGPDELDGLEDRLAERFRAGLVVGLEPPELPVRRAILDKRARLDGVALEPAVLDAIAERVTSSVRALEGALIQVVAYASMRGEEPTVELAERLLHRLGGPTRARDCSVADVIVAAERAFDVRREDLLARDRRPQVSSARQVAMFVARELTGESLPEIGRRFGGRNHTTVLHAIKKVEAAVQADPDVDNAVRAVTALLRADRRD